MSKLTCCLIDYVLGLTLGLTVHSSNIVIMYTKTFHNINIFCIFS